MYSKKHFIHVKHFYVSRENILLLMNSAKFLLKLHTLKMKSHVASRPNLALLGLLSAVFDRP